MVSHRFEPLSSDRFFILRYETWWYRFATRCVHRLVHKTSHSPFLKTLESKWSGLCCAIRFYTKFATETMYFYYSHWDQSFTKETHGRLRCIEFRQHFVARYDAFEANSHIIHRLWMTLISRSEEKCIFSFSPFDRDHVMFSQASIHEFQLPASKSH